MSDTQQALQAARKRFDSDNIFQGGSHVASYRAYEELRRAEVAAWKAGECCGRRGENGRCLSRGCEVARILALQDAGESRANAAAKSGLCEHGDMLQTLIVAHQVMVDSGSPEPFWVVAHVILTQVALGHGIETVDDIG